MAHPMKSKSRSVSTRDEGVKGHNALLRKYTRDYGAANPSMNQAAAVDAMEQSGPQEAVGFGVEGNSAPTRADRLRRGKAAPTTQTATYKRGGAVQNRAEGGRVKKGRTNVNIMIMPGGGVNSMQHPGMMDSGAVPMPAIPPGGGAALPPGSATPPMPMMNPAIAAAMGAGGPRPGMPPMRRRGGALHPMEKAEHPDVREDEALIRKLVKPSSLKRARGGKIHMTAGSESGEGRLEKSESWRRHGDKRKQVV